MIDMKEWMDVFSQYDLRKEAVVSQSKQRQATPSKTDHSRNPASQAK